MITKKTMIAAGVGALSALWWGEAEAQRRHRRRDEPADPPQLPAYPAQAAPVVTPLAGEPAPVPPQVIARLDAIEAAVRTPPTVPPAVAARLDALEVAQARARTPEEPPSDHSRVVGHLGLGLLGVASLPYPGGMDSRGSFNSRIAIGSTHTVDAPTFGARYWLRERVGVDLGLGIALGSDGGHTFATSTGDTPASGTSLFALSLHAGLPIVLFHGRHYNFLAIPELNLGFSSGGDDGASATDLNDDNSYSGLMIEVGARVGAEVHLGFIGLPYLALQMSVGLAVRYESRTYSNASNTGQTGQRFGLNSGRNFDLDSILLHGLGLILYLP